MSIDKMSIPKKVSISLTTVEMGKKTATSALIGFIVVFSAYWIVKLIETITGLKLISL